MLPNHQEQWCLLPQPATPADLSKIDCVILFKPQPFFHQLCAQAICDQIPLDMQGSKSIC